MRRMMIVLGVMSLLAFHISPHTTQQEGKVHTFGHDEEVDSIVIYKVFHRNAPVDFHTPGVPTLAYVGKNGMFIVGIGGYAKTVFGWDFGHPVESPDEFITANIPMEVQPGDETQFNLSAMQSHLFLNFVAFPGSSNEIGAFISANFLNNYVPVLQFAYLKYHGLQAGYDYSLFSDPACNPQAIDYEGPCSSTASPVASLRYQHILGKQRQWELGIGLEYPGVSATAVDGRNRIISQRVPNIPVSVKYNWGEEESWLKFSGIVRNMYYRDIAASRNVDKAGYGLQLSCGVNFLEKLTFFGQGVWGRGIGSQIQDTQNEGLDLVPTGNGSELTPVMMWGATAALEYDISDRFCCSTTYSQVRGYTKKFDDGTTNWGDMYKYAQYVSANFFWHVTSYFDVGIEHIWGRRVNNDGRKSGDNRLQGMVQLSF